MNNPMNWSFPIFRLFGISVRVHIFLPIITFGLFFRQVIQSSNSIWWGDILLLTVIIPFFSVLLHEFGHCFGSRAVGGEAEEILMWPLGGLAFVTPPHNWRAHTITVAAGPLVNFGICLFCTVLCLGAGFVPSFTLRNPYVSEVTNYRDGKIYTAPGFEHRYSRTTGKEVKIPAFSDADVIHRPTEVQNSLETYIRNSADTEIATAPTWIVWLNRIFFINWMLFLFNLIPAYPLDGGQILQGIVWARRDYRTGASVAAYSGFVCGTLFMLLSISTGEPLFMGLALFMLYRAQMVFADMENEEGTYGDFSQGYTSLEKDDPPPPPRKKLNFFRRWLKARAAKRLRRENEQRRQEDERMDQLLDKIAREGKSSLTDEENRFMSRVSERYRNRS